jgi:hypothetical protein
VGIHVRSLGFSVFALICFNFSHCVNYSSPPLSEAQRLLTAKPWILVYADSFYIDSTSMAQKKYRIFASECEKLELLTLGDSNNYYMKLVCGQPAPALLKGEWRFDPDSTLVFSSWPDTFVYSSANIAKLKIITSDSLRLIQQVSFTHPDTRNPNYYEMTYAH